jgi:uncharacterized protein YbjT (DUF2867 family)
MSNDSSISKKKILVLGANGKTGSRVLQKLTSLSWPVQAGSRKGNPGFDWENPSTWAPALKGIHSVYVSFQPDLAVPRAVEIIRKFSDTAFKSGIKKLVLLSGRGEADAERCENIIINSGVDWTIIRASWFSQNFSEGNFLDPVLAGHVALPVGNIGEPFVDADDIADVAVAALTQDGHNKKMYEVTGPRLLTFQEAVAEIASATRRDIKFVQIPFDEYKVALNQYGLPPELVSLITYLFTEVLDGRNAGLTNGVQEALGRKPKDFSEYVRETAATGVWNK